MSHENTKGKWILEVNRLWRYSLLLKIDRQRIHTVPLPGLGGTVIEDMSQEELEAMPEWDGTGTPLDGDVIVEDAI